MDNLIVTASQIAPAIDRAKSMHADWMAECLEIALLPTVYERWRLLNEGRYTLERVDGLPHTFNDPAQNRAVGAARRWHEYAGYVMSHWNSKASPDYDSGYSHGPSRAWDGVSRLTTHMFIESLRQAFHLPITMGMKPARTAFDALDRAGVSFVDDRALPPQ